MTRVLYYVGPTVHPMFKMDFRFPPEGFAYVPSTPQLVADQVKREVGSGHLLRFKAGKRLKRWAAGALGRVGIPRLTYTNAKGCSLIHSVRYMLLNKTPWVVEVEDATDLAWYSPTSLRRNFTRSNIRYLLSSDYCRRILPWTDAARQSLLSVLGPGFVEKKMQVVHPCAEASGLDPRRTLQHKFQTLLWVASWPHPWGFYYKGGWETLLAFERVYEKNRNARLLMVGFVPRPIQERYGRHEGIRFLCQIPNAELETCYEQADAFVLPTHTDTFGFVYLEAFAHGLPCIGVKHYAVPEIIQNNVTGCLIDCDACYFGKGFLSQYDSLLDKNHGLIEKLKAPSERYVESLACAMNLLLEDPERRVGFAEAAYAEAVEGQFSPSSRQRVLKDVYEACLD